MKIRPSKKSLLVFICAFCFSNIFSQPCSVNVDSLKGQYVGSCKKGKADGKGTATGVDSYIGNFKKGYPDGYGKYTWKNGSWYEGYWKKGVFEGEGNLHMVKTETSESFQQKGFWENGSFIGIHKYPFSVEIFSNKISGVNVNKTGKTGDYITIIVKSTTGGGSTIMGGSPIKIDSSITISNTIAKASLTGLEVQTGSYLSRIDDKSSQVNNKYTLQHVVYPITLLLSFESERVKVEIFEKGIWNIAINLDK